MAEKLTYRWRGPLVGFVNVASRVARLKSC